MTKAELIEALEPLEDHHQVIAFRGDSDMPIHDTQVDEDHKTGDPILILDCR